MARWVGKDARVYLGSRDISGDIGSITPTLNADTHDVTNFSSNDWKESDAGLLSWEASVEGWYQPQAGGIGRQFEDLLGATGGVLSLYEGDADAVGDHGFLGGDSILTQRGQPISVADVVKLTGRLQGTGRASLEGRLLHVLGAETATGNGTALDNSASSANGGRGNLHVTAASGTWTIKIQHSADDVTYSDLITFTQLTDITSESKEVTGTVNRYLRVSHTEDVAGSVTYVCGFARY